MLFLLQSNTSSFLFRDTHTGLPPSTETHRFPSLFIKSNNFQMFIPERKYGIFKSSFVENNAWIIANYLCPIRSNAWILTNFLYPIFSDISKSCHERQWIDENETFVITFTHWNLNQETELLSNQLIVFLFVLQSDIRIVFYSQPIVYWILTLSQNCPDFHKIEMTS
jgi:hypothetical protein